MGIGIVGATLISAGVGAAASIYSANKQTAAAKAALNLQQNQYQQARTDLAPYRDLGNNALGSLNALYGYGTGTGTGGQPGTPNYTGFANSPDYNFALQQGGLAVDRSAAARGLLQSGGNIKDQIAFGQGLASQQYGNYVARLQNMLQVGAGAAGGSASAATAFGTQGGQSLNNVGAAQASGAVGIANALSTLPQNLLYAQAFGGQGGTNSPSSYAYQPGSSIPGQPGMYANALGNATYATGA